MKRFESDKEDLMAEATALVERGEFCCGKATAEEVATVGFRRDGSLSIYFGQDPFYQFDGEGLLRRAWENGFLYRSQGDTLAKLERSRTEHQTTLRRTDLSKEQLLEFQTRLRDHLSEFLSELSSNFATSRRIISQDGDFVARICASLRQILQCDSIFLSQTIRVRR